MKDLLLLVADKSMEYTLLGGLGRPQALGIRSITFDIRVHPDRDRGVRTTGAQILNLQEARYRHAFLMLDYEGSGSKLGPAELESELDNKLRGWGDRAKSIVINPELDVWLWATDNLLAQILSWPVSAGGIRDWIQGKGFELDESSKPKRPKEAFEAVFTYCREPRSAANYKKIAERTSLQNCEDPAFQRFHKTLQEWFPPAHSL